LIEAKTNKNVTIISLAAGLGVSRETILRDIKKLKEMNLLKRVG
jgi:DeoR/GlpR family transcriptional regulator of sugar metabolism